MKVIIDNNIIRHVNIEKIRKTNILKKVPVTVNGFTVTGTNASLSFLIDSLTICKLPMEPINDS